jgi:hypothetical protein
MMFPVGAVSGTALVFLQVGANLFGDRASAGFAMRRQAVTRPVRCEKIGVEDVGQRRVGGFMDSELRAIRIEIAPESHRMCETRIVVQESSGGTSAFTI